MRYLLLALVVFVSGCLGADLNAPMDDIPIESNAPGNGSDGEPDSTESNENYRQLDDSGPVGSLNTQYLSGGIPKVIVEVDYSSGNLRSVTEDKIEEVFSEVSGKSEVVFSGGNVVESAQSYSASDLRSLESDNRNHYSSEDGIVLYVLVLDGEYANGNALGVAYSASSIAVFPDRMRSATTSLILYSEIERAVITHEIGHIFGLVNIGYESERNHEDSSHPGHSSNKDSVMYWAVEDISISNVFNLGPPEDFDDDDLFDLEMIRNG